MATTWRAKKTSQCPECRLLIVKFRHMVMWDYETREVLHVACQVKRAQRHTPSTGQPS